MEHEEFLRRTGATESALSDDSVRELEERGFTVLRETLAPDLLTRVRDAFDAATKAPEHRGVQHIDEPLSLASGDGPDARSFEEALLAPRLLAGVQALLGAPFRLFTFGGRAPSPGFGRQGLHADWTPMPGGAPAVSATALVCLDPFVPGNGSTRLVPGSHRLPGAVPRSFSDPKNRHAAEVQMSAAAGDTLLFSSHLWHAGAENRSTGSRRALQIQFVLRSIAARPGSPVYQTPDPSWSPELRALLAAD